MAFPVKNSLRLNWFALSFVSSKSKEHDSLISYKLMLRAIYALLSWTRQHINGRLLAISATARTQVH